MTKNKSGSQPKKATRGKNALLIKKKEESSLIEIKDSIMQDENITEYKTKLTITGNLKVLDPAEFANLQGLILLKVTDNNIEKMDFVLPQSRNRHGSSTLWYRWL
jgi:hypothetical protein